MRTAVNTALLTKETTKLATCVEVSTVYSGTFSFSLFEVLYPSFNFHCNPFPLKPSYDGQYQAQLFS